MTKKKPPEKPHVQQLRAAILTIEANLPEVFAVPPEVGRESYQLGVLHALRWVTGADDTLAKEYGL